MSEEDLVKRNTVEIVTEEELDNIRNNKPIVYCGYETSGPVHIGHMVTLQKLIDFQKEGFKVKILFADVHTLLNHKGSEEWIGQMTKYWRECFDCLGLEKAEFVLGSSFQYEKEYIHDVLQLGVKTTMKRALRSMQEIARDIDNAHVSQTIYPLMQAVDIKALEADIAYGGIEQRKIHMLARETLPDLEYKKPVCIHTPLMCSLGGPDSKMSSSKPETIIAVDDTPEAIKKKINSSYCPPETENNPVLDTCKLIIYPRQNILKVERPEKFGGNQDYEDFNSLLNDYESKKLHPQDLKNAVGDALIDILKPVGKRIKKKGLNIPNI